MPPWGKVVGAIVGENSGRRPRFVDPALDVDLLGSALDAADHAAEDEAMEGQDGVPIEDSQQALRLESGDLLKSRSTRKTRNRIDSELQESLSW